MKRTLLLLLALISSPLLAADPPEEVRPVPPPGVPVPDDVRAELTAGAASLAKEIAKLKTELADKPKLLALVPDVEIFHKAVDWALRYDEFFDRKQFDAARKQLAIGMDRLNALRDGRAPWEEETGLVARAYRSNIDGSVQPYGLVIPDTWKASDKKADPARFLAARARREDERAGFPGGPHEQARGVYAGEHDRGASVRALLQCEQVCRRDGSFRNAGGGEKALPGG